MGGQSDSALRAGGEAVVTQRTEGLRDGSPAPLATRPPDPATNDHETAAHRRAEFLAALCRALAAWPS